MLQIVRRLLSGVDRYHKKAYLMSLWFQVHQTENATLDAAIYAYFDADIAPEKLPRVPFNFNSLSNEQYLDKFRFDKSQIAELVTLFGLETIQTRERTVATGVEGLCIVLYKLVVPMRWTELEPVFGRSASGMSNLFLHVLDHIDTKFANLLRFNHEYAASNMKVYADAVFDAGGVMQNVWAFVDGTVRGICRPGPRNIRRDGKYLSQKSVYNGHKRKHALKYQTLSTPDGLITHLYGPFPGRNHDIKLFKESRIAKTIHNDVRFQSYRIFGDQAYGNDEVLCSPFAGVIGNLTADQRIVNRSMSKVRVAVEWSYGQVTNYWTALDFKRQSRVGVQPVGMMYRVGVLLTNCITCARGGNTTSDYFGVAPPSLQEYLQ